jgi:hypothetical protein
MDSPDVPINVFDYEVAEGIANAWELTAEEVLSTLREGLIDGETLNALRSAKREVLKQKGVHPRRMPPRQQDG